MELFLTHKSALEYWRLHGLQGTAHESARRSRKRTVPGYPPAASALSQADLRGLTLPLDVTVGNKNARRTSCMVRSHVLSELLPEGCFVDIGNGLFVSSPEFCFFQMASGLKLAKAVELGLELCGSYSLLGNNSARAEVESISGAAIVGEENQESVRRKGFYKRPPLTSAKKLGALATRMAGMNGLQQVDKVLPYITDGSASPMETILVILLSLPYRMGGYGLPLPEMNIRINLSKTVKTSASKAYYVCDLFWPKVNIAAEYDSDTFHTGADRIASDSKRRNTLASAGLVVITVTNQQIRSVIEFEKVAKLLARNMGRRLQYHDNPKFLELRQQLRGMLLV